MLNTLLCLILSALPALASSSSSVYTQYPLQDQLPLIARVNQTYSWSFSYDTFVSTHNHTLQYTTSALPEWLSFNNATLTFSGTPTSSDEGTPGVLVTATDPETSDSADSYVTLCVTPYAPPQLHVPVTDQFYAANPSLSSVFLLSQNSALNNSRPALRIPPKWSFSIGFLYDTFTSNGDLYYAATREDGAPLPSWIEFNTKAITFDGVTPMQGSSEPMTVSVALHASDQEGYSAASVPFDIVVAAHELSLPMSSLPTINITASTPFNFSLTSPDDFFGVLLDGQPIQPSQILSLDIDTSSYKNWLKYDSSTRTLSGIAPDDADGEADSPVLPVTLTASVNQTIETNVSLAIVPSYFSTPTLQPVLALPGADLHFDLVQYFSNSTGLGSQRDDVNLTAAFDPTSASSYLNFDPGSAQLSGTPPSNIPSSYTHITITFTAYSHVTHSTSHTSLPISLSNADYSKQKTGGLSAAAKAKLLLGLKIAFGIISGVIGLIFGLALLRRCARVPDTAMSGEEGTRAWTADEMKWYGIGIEVDGKVTEGPPHASQEILSGDDSRSEKEHHVGASRMPDASAAGLGSPQSPQSPGVMRKGEFIGRIRATARIVSDKARNVSDAYHRSVGRRRKPVIGKPTLIMTSDHRVSAMTGVPLDGLPFTNDALGPPLPSRARAPLPFEDGNASQYAPSGISSIVGSPSSSTGGRSIPRRRADFAPPRSFLKTPPQAHAADKKAARGSVDSAVVQMATRATSMRSGISLGSERDSRGHGANAKGPEAGRPRLVPFTSASRVPVPKVPVSDPDAPVAGTTQGAKTKRVASQVARVFRGVTGVGRAPAVAEGGERSADDLATSAQYVHVLGDDAQSAASIGSGRIPIVPRMLARTGEQFKFRVPVSYSAGSPLAGGRGKTLEARLLSGAPLPAFVKSDLTAVSGGAGARVEKRVVEFWGTPGARDTGELNVGIYERQGDRCVGRVIIQIVERS
ncbi:hypothetical protein IEO21_05861 [Rhodonia placenta]|uniref:Dystroglycan-type cadherin-like domain-containing protein n=1 Tax=Rhodonia placenta TaxID=104341 RepID=A0A8H7U1V6_9APHY|nr:hypothetical protein IEO21_05861 [Postia placenta]